MSEILMTEEDLNYVRETLAAVHVYLHAQDIADSTRVGREEVRVSTLTREVASTLETVEEAYSAFLLREADRARFSLADDEDEDLEPLDEDDD